MYSTYIQKISIIIEIIEIWFGFYYFLHDIMIYSIFYDIKILDTIL